MKPAKLSIQSLKFSIPDDPFEYYLAQINRLENQLSSLAKRAGTENLKFKAALNSLVESVRRNRDLETELDSPVKVRALAVSLTTSCAEHITLTQRILNKIDQLRPKPSTLFIQSVYQFYLNRYDKLENPGAIAGWLLKALPKRNLKKTFHETLLSSDGPRWLAEKSIQTNREFQNMVSHLGLDRYASGRFLTVANNIYYIEQLKSIPLNQPHNLLLEVQKTSVYKSTYDKSYLVGHKVLEILISRAENTKIDDSWLNVIMSIAGDPRVPRDHPLFRKWWSLLDQHLYNIVIGWLSKLDLRLFLEALENFSNLPGKEELHRMFPSRKKFLEGLDDKKLIAHTRLYLSKSAERYLKKNYKPEHLPAYSIVNDGTRSLIHVQFANSQAHMIEGSHSCYLWIYRQLHSSAVIYDYGANSVFYNDLTSGLNYKMMDKNCEAVAQIKHTPVNSRWQKNAIEALRRLGVNISPQDVLSSEDYKSFKRKFGVI